MGPQWASDGATLSTKNNGDNLPHINQENDTMVGGKYQLKIKGGTHYLFMMHVMLLCSNPYFIQNSENNMLNP